MGQDTTNGLTEREDAFAGWIGDDEAFARWGRRSAVDIGFFKQVAECKRICDGEIADEIDRGFVAIVVVRGHAFQRDCVDFDRLYGRQCR